MTNFWAVGMAKDEGDIIRYSLCNMAANGASGIIIADNMSSDNTMEEILEAQKIISSHYPYVNLIIKQDPVVEYTQSEKMSALASEARSYGAQWIIPFDIDELWFSPHSTLLTAFSQLDHMGYDIYKALYTNHSVTEFDPTGASPFHTMQYKWDRPTNWKSAFKFRESDQFVRISNGNHFVQHNGMDIGHGVNVAFDDILPDGASIGMWLIQIRHFQWRSLEHFIKKITNAYKACKALGSSHDLYNGAAWQQHFGVFETDGLEGLVSFFNKNILVTGELGALIHDPAPLMEIK